MLKKFVGAGIVMVLVGSVALAETVSGIITKLTDKEITITPFKKGDDGKFEKGEPATYKITSDTKVSRRKGFKKDVEPEAVKLSDLQEAVTKAAKSENKFGKNIFAKVEVEGGKVTSISYGGFGGKGKGKKGKKKDE